MQIMNGLATLGKLVIKHSPELLTGLGIVGLVGSAISAIKNTPIALEKMKEAEESVEVEEPLTPVEKVKVCWKFYIFPIVIAIVSILCIIFANRISYGRMASVMTACKISEETVQRLDQSTKEVVTDKQYQKIKEKAAEKDISRVPMIEGDIINTGTGSQLYFESYSGRYFRASRDFVDRAINNFNSKLLDNDTMSLNDYLECLNLPYLDSQTTGGLLGWRLDTVKRFSNELPKAWFRYEEISTGESCGYLRLDVDPMVNYDKYF